jgi:hypothetical protein
MCVEVIVFSEKVFATQLVAYAIRISRAVKASRQEFIDRSFDCNRCFF